MQSLVRRSRPSLRRLQHGHFVAPDVPTGPRPPREQLKVSRRRAERLDELVERLRFCRMRGRPRYKGGALVSKRGHWVPARREETMLRLVPQPGARPKMRLYPSKNRPGLESPGVEHFTGNALAEVKDWCPKPQDRVLLCDLGHRQTPDLLKRHCWIWREAARRMGLAEGFKWPRRVDNDDAIRSARQRRRFGSDALGVLHVGEPAPDSISASGTLHILEKASVLFRLSFGRIHHRGCLGQSRSADAGETGHLVERAAPGKVFRGYPGTHALLSFGAHRRLERPLDRHGFGECEVLPQGVLSKLALDDVAKVDHVRGNGLAWFHDLPGAEAPLAS